MKKWLLVIPIVFVLLALCAAIAGTLYFAVRNNRVAGINLPFSGSLNAVAESQEEKVFPVDGPAGLSVKNTFGTVEVKAGKVEQITVNAKKTARGRTQEQAEQNLDSIVLSMTQTGNEVEIDVDIVEGTNSWGGSIDFTIVVPEETDVVVSSVSGDVDLRGTTGPAQLTSQFGSVTVENVEGTISAETRNGSVRVRDVEAGKEDIRLKSDFGEVTLENSNGGSISLNSTNGALKIERVNASGPVTLESEFGSIEFRTGQANGLKLTTRNGEIKVADVKVSGDLNAHSDFGPVRVEGTSAKGYDLKSMNGGIDLNGASGKITVNSDFGAITVENADADILSIKNSNGPIEFSGKLGEGPHTLESSMGAVTLHLPEDAAFAFDLKTEMGKISSAFDITITGTPDEEHWVGSVNGGKNLLTVITRNGNIALEAGD